MPASYGVHCGGARNSYSTAITNQLWTFEPRVPPTTPSSCILSGQFSFVLHPTNSQFLLLTFVAWTTLLLMLCPVFRCSGSTNSPLRQIQNQLQFPPQRRPSGWSPSLSSVPGHCTLHTSCLPSRNLQVHYLLLLQTMGSFPRIRATATLFRLLAQVSFPTIKLHLAGIRFAHIENSLPTPLLMPPPPSLTFTRHQAHQWTFLSPPSSHHYVCHASVERSACR